MHEQLPCHIVRDLLPSYLEGLTEPETAAAVEAHLALCPDCAACRRRMEEGEAALPAAEEKEVDYLKTVRKKGHRNILMAAVLAAVLVLCAAGARFFLVGWVSDGSSLAVTPTVSEDGQFLHLDLFNTATATVILGWNTETQEDGVLTVTAREALVSPLHHPEDAVSMDLPLEGITHVYFCGRLLWQEGLVIDRSSFALLGAVNPYTGDAPAMGRLIDILNPELPASFALQTAQEPFGVTLRYSVAVPMGLRPAVEGRAALLLALTGNLGEVRWEDAGGWSGSLTLEEANTRLARLVPAYNEAHGTEWTVPDSVRALAGSPFGIQQLRALFAP